MRASGRQRKEVFITGPNPEVLRFRLVPCLSGDFSGDGLSKERKRASGSGPWVIVSRGKLIKNLQAHDGFPAGLVLGLMAAGPPAWVTVPILAGGAKHQSHWLVSYFGCWQDGQSPWGLDVCIKVGLRILQTHRRF